MFKGLGDVFTNIRSFFTFSLAIMYLSNIWIKSVWLNHMILVFMVPVLILSLIAVTGSSKVIGYASLTISVLILLYYDAPFYVWEQALEENLYLVVMFTLVPLLRIPIQHGGYFEPLQAFFRRFVNTPRKFYLLVSFISAFVGVLVNLAVVPLVHEISKASNLSRNQKLLTSAISRGFATSTLWSPTMASIALIIQLTGATWHMFFPFALLCGLIAGMIGYVMMLFEEKSMIFCEEEQSTVCVHTTQTEQRSQYGKVIELSVFGVILISSIALISLVTGIQTIIIVSLSALIFPIIWLTIIKRVPVLLRELKGEYFHKSLPGLKNEIVLFVGAGLFASSITYSHLGDYIPRILTMVVGNNIILFSAVVLSICLGLAALGVHPIVSITVIAGTVKGATYGVTPTYMAVLLASAWTMSISLSPAAANIIAIAGLTEQSPVQIGLSWNRNYVLLASLIILMLITSFRWFGLI